MFYAQPRSIPLTAAGRKRRERESKCQNHSNDAESKIWSVLMSSTERKRRKRVSKRKNCPVFGLVFRFHEKFKIKRVGHI
jgi:hypothetical protein